MEIAIDKWVVHTIKSGKKTSNTRKSIVKQGKNQCTWKRGKLQVLFEARLCSRNIIKGVNTLAVPLVRLLWTILNIYTGDNQTNRPEDKKIDDDAKYFTSER